MLSTSCQGASWSRAATRRACAARPSAPSRVRSVSTRADSRDRSDGFMTGFVVGGAVFGALGFIFAPAISKALIGDDQRLRLPRFLEEEVKDPAQAKQELFDKIANLNASIDEVAAKLKTKEPEVVTDATTSSVAQDLKKLLQL